MIKLTENYKSQVRTKINSPLGKANGSSQFVSYSTEIDWGDIDIANSSLLTNFSEFLENGKLTSLGIIKILEWIYEHGGQSEPDIPEVITITWDKNSGTTEAEPNSTQSNINEAIVFPFVNPIREYTITWNNNGGSGASGGSNKVTYTFTGWFDNASNGNEISEGANATTNATYYAHWNAPTSITLPSNPTRNGYTFAGWATTSNSSTSNVNVNTIPTSNVTYYAVWTQIATYTITWNRNGATSPTSNITTTVEQGQAVTLPNDPIREYTITWNNNGGSGASGGSSSVSYPFKGWFTSSSGTTQVTSSTIPDGNRTYYAQWNNQSSITLPTTEPTREGYTFKGWYTSASGGNQVTSNTAITGKTTFYAQWEENEQEYYWYAGQSNPANMTEISPILSGENEWTSGSGWHALGETLPESIDQLVKGGTAGQIWYAAIPVDAQLVAGSSADPDTSVTQGSIVTIPSTNGVQYQIWISEGTTGTRYGAQFSK